MADPPPTPLAAPQVDDEPCLRACLQSTCEIVSSLRTCSQLSNVGCQCNGCCTDVLPPPPPPPSSQLVIGKFILNGPIDAFDPHAFAHSLAVILPGGLRADHVSVAVTSGSVHVIASISVRSADAAYTVTALEVLSTSAKQASQLLGVDVAFVYPPEVRLLESPPLASSPSEPSLSPHMMPIDGGGSDALTAGLVNGMVATLASLVAVLVVAIGLARCRLGCSRWQIRKTGVAGQIADTHSTCDQSCGHTSGAALPASNNRQVHTVSIDHEEEDTEKEVGTAQRVIDVKLEHHALRRMREGRHAFEARTQLEGPTAHGCHPPMYPAKRTYIVNAQRLTEQELTTTGYETSSTSTYSSPRSEDSSPRPAEPRSGRGKVVLASGVASPSRNTVYV